MRRPDYESSIMIRSERRTEPAGASGVAQVKAFYDNDGWKWVDGESGDARRWGHAPSGPIQKALRRRHIELVRRSLHLDPVGTRSDPVSMVEFGGGGQPAVFLLDAVDSYTGVDISSQGLKAAAAAIEPFRLAARFIEADVRALPIEDAQFDVAFCAHMLYHLPSVDDQRRALHEMARVVRPGGVLAVIGANPYPIAFPGRCLRRAIADAPVLGPLANALRPPPPLPYLPMSHAWRAAQLAAFGTTTTHPCGVPTPSFCRRVDESGATGRLLWRGIAGLEARAPRLACRLGNFTMVVLQKTGG